MKIRLKNMGIIKKANIKIDGLTVIAGENDTGKSTVGKALFWLLSDITQTLNNSRSREKDFQEHPSLHKLVFGSQMSGGEIGIKLNNSSPENTFTVPPKGEVIPILKIDEMTFIQNEHISFPIFIESPIVWNFTNFFRDVALVESQMNIKLDYSYLMKDLNFKLHIKNASSGIDIKEELTDLMSGEFKKDERDHYYFDKNGKRIELINTATGIKTFGIFQVLSQNGWLNKNSVLILDEPEVHLHPKWQLKMAETIVKLVKTGVKVLVNSHSPYMIEALQRYSDLASVKSDFYLAKDGCIKKENNSNSETLTKIFEKLSMPFDVFEKMDSQKMGKILNG